MSEHGADIAWDAGDVGFRRGRFSRNHQWQFENGIVVDASASPQVVPAPYSDPNALDPEQAFVAAIASCHMMSFLHLANRAGLEVLSYRDCAIGILGPTGAGQQAITQVTLKPLVTYAGDTLPSTERQATLHQQAHKLCFIANSVTSEIIVEPRSSP